MSLPDSAYFSDPYSEMMSRQSNNGKNYQQPFEDPYMSPMQGPSNQYRDNSQSLAPGPSIHDTTFRLGFENTFQDNVDPALRQSNSLLGMAQGNEVPLEQMSLIDSVGLSPSLSFLNRYRQSLTSNPTRNNPGALPWSSIQVIGDDMKRQRDPQDEANEMAEKRHRLHPSSNPRLSLQQSTSNMSSSFISLSPSQRSHMETQVYQHSMVSAHSEHGDEPLLSKEREEFTCSGQAPSFLSDQPATPRKSKSGPGRPASRKPKHRCDTCGRDSFTSRNDMERHQATLHKNIKLGAAVYLCKVPGCPQSAKVWARLDNFKSHVLRMHQGSQYASQPERMFEPYDPAIHKLDSPRGGRHSVSSSDPNELTIDPEFGHSPSRAQTVAQVRRSSGTLEVPNSRRQQNLVRRTRRCSHASRASGTYGDQRSEISQQVIYQPTAATGFNNQSEHFTSRLHQISENGLGFGLSMKAQPQGPNTIADTSDAWRQRLEDPQESREYLAQTPIEPLAQADLAGFADHFQINDQSEPGFENDDMGLSDTNMMHLDTGRPKDVPDIDEVRKMMNSLRPDQRQALLKDFNPGPQPPAGQRSVGSKSKGKKADGEKFSCGELIEDKDGNKICESAFAKKNELKKHKKRHKRQYFCTFDNCFQRFGTKWEWKRHENSQHIQLEAWRCGFAHDQDPCARIFKDKNSFMHHLGNDHNLYSQAAVSRCETDHLYKRWHGSFWCGFCIRIILSTASDGIGQDNERNDHITNHLDKELDKYNWETWQEVEGLGKTRKEMFELHNKDDDDGISDDDDAGERATVPAVSASARAHRLSRIGGARSEGITDRGHHHRVSSPPVLDDPISPSRDAPQHNFEQLVEAGTQLPDSFDFGLDEPMGGMFI